MACRVYYPVKTAFLKGVGNFRYIINVKQRLFWRFITING